ncbi:twin-arginine translocase subunit TatB [Rhodobacter sp. TJ_12]|uniref:Sec-independent protein translocase protein TatB n=1 Tax=Rhodobacter sp. TJ_12 TaxID=2029399 RepID=UPI001CBC3B73|nr:Sec-independent protein translocase protein TatB [Rhodobacter sp. TJ_12]MBZ4023932.1 twin-arginine translocase subunit TatB [Rhodobacter sp. TJ_12]
MFDIGWSELLVIGVVALIVVGPKDLPVMFRSLGRVTAKARAMARDFTRAMEDAAKETGLDDAAKGLGDIARAKAPGISALERATDKFEKWEPKMPSAAKAGAGTAAGAAFTPDPALQAELDAAELAGEPEEASADPVKPAPKGDA